MFAYHQFDVLETGDRGQLGRAMNDTVTQLGHGRLVRAPGETQDIGGGTDGGSRRAIDEWAPPDWRMCVAGSLDLNDVG